MSRMKLAWRGAPSNTRHYAEWFGTRTIKGLQYRGHIISISTVDNGAYKWSASIGGRDIASGTESATSGGLPAAKESIDIALSDAQ